MDWTQIIVGVIGLVGLVLTGVLVPYVRSRMSATQLATLDYWVRVFVAAAETVFKTEGAGAAKRDWVFVRLHEMGLKFDDEAVGAKIEAVVRELTAAAVINTGD